MIKQNLHKVFPCQLFNDTLGFSHYWVQKKTKQSFFKKTFSWNIVNKSCILDLASGEIQVATKWHETCSFITSHCLAKKKNAKKKNSNNKDRKKKVMEQQQWCSTNNYKLVILFPELQGIKSILGWLKTLSVQIHSLELPSINKVFKISSSEI